MANVVKKTTTKTIAKSKQPTLATSATPHRRGTQRDRLSCRIDPKIKQRAEEAATLLGQDLTAFTETALNEKAQAVIEREEKILLSARDFAHFKEAIENPQPPNNRLKAAAEEYKAVRRQQPELNW